MDFSNYLVEDILVKVDSNSLLNLLELYALFRFLVEHVRIGQAAIADESCYA